MTLNELETLDKIYEDILSNYENIKTLKDFEDLIKEEGIKAINNLDYNRHEEQTDKYRAYLIENILTSIEDEAYEISYKYAKVLYEITK